MKLRRLLPWLLLTSLAGALAGALLAHMLTQSSVALQGGTWLARPRALGPFSLTDTEGRSVTNDALRGHATLVYFGFTACPDVCPATLATLRDLRARAPLADLRMWFVTIDPERDTPQALREYLAAFGPGFVGLRAAPAALPALLQEFSAYAGKREQPGGGYGVDHSATLFLIDGRARLIAVFNPPLQAPALDADLRKLAASHQL
ncbi:MAG: SCO family protein [Steroidobacteraceae bacterium]